ncbi:hypothetical protein [Paenibacillus sp. MBLB4367]|uniref:hypothetical protein n=1 Tax=Paenibacillus sp. MBLB4367 TaxID=3384767 RepID=UPI0039083604
MSYYYHRCREYLDREVEITTRHGKYRGTIVKVDRNTVQLRSRPRGGDRYKARTSFFFFPIITLVLFDLLAIALISGGGCGCGCGCGRRGCFRCDRCDRCRNRF